MFFQENKHLRQRHKNKCPKIHHIVNQNVCFVYEMNNKYLLSTKVHINYADSKTFGKQLQLRGEGENSSESTFGS